MAPTDLDADDRELIESVGPWRFTTRRTYRLRDGSRAVWQSRHHRKRLPPAVPSEQLSPRAILLRSLWMPWHMSWWIGVVFAVGSSLFVLGSILSLAPSLARSWSFDPNTVSAIFFAGSIPFSTAAYLQLFQAANASELTASERLASRSVQFLGWRPRDIGWLSCALQFGGTLLFNLNTFDAMRPDLSSLQRNLEIWVPDLAGSILFLLSGYLAFAEVSHARWAWKPWSLSWWVTAINLVGCMAFMASAVFAYVPSSPAKLDGAVISVAFTLFGALGFLIGSLLMLPEAAAPAKP
jgi:hypothetical protein